MNYNDLASRHDRPASSLATFLKAKRQNAGLTLTALAERTGIARTQLSRIERGISANPSPRLLVRIAEKGGLGVSATDLLCMLASSFGVRELPDFPAYLYATHPDWPDAALQSIIDFYQFLSNKYMHNRDEGIGDRTRWE